MKFGLNVTLEYPIGENMAERLDQHLELVRAAGRYGFDSVIMGQHYLSVPYQRLQPTAAIARMAAEAGDLRLGVIILFPLNHPVYLAEMLSTLDIISKGRLFVSPAMGYRDVEFSAFEIPMAERGGRFEECVEVVKRLWTEDKVTHEGKYYRLKDVTMTIRPFQKSHPPLWIAANNDPAIKRAARVGDTWFLNPHADLATLKKQVELYKQTLRELGKSFPREFPIVKEMYIAKDKKTALEEATPYLGQKYKAYAQWGQDKALPGQESFDAPLEELMKDRFIIGGPDECAEAIKRHRDELGVNYMLFRMRWGGMDYTQVLKELKLFSEAVMPQFQ